jgi:hypothetical protein
VAIGLVDGYFARVPAVWHKEILWAMSQGIHVFGAASMGALRAAELAAFGMEGVGAIFEQYRSGALIDDDEVAIVHAGADRGYQPLSEAMVNVRATLAAAERAGVIADGRSLAAALAALPYPERSFSAPELDAAEMAALRRWLPTGRVDQKREDALAMLRVMAERARLGWVPKQVDYRFAPSDAFEALRTSVTSEAAAGSVDEAALPPGALDGAMVRALCLALAQRSGLQIDAQAVQAVAEEFRRERGLLDAASFDRWIEKQGLDEAGLTAFMQREAIVRRIEGTFERERLLQLADHLR